MIHVDVQTVSFFERKFFSIFLRFQSRRCDLGFFSGVVVADVGVSIVIGVLFFGVSGDSVVIMDDDLIFVSFAVVVVVDIDGDDGFRPIFRSVGRQAIPRDDQLGAGGPSH